MKILSTIILSLGLFQTAYAQEAEPSFNIDVTKLEASVNEVLDELAISFDLVKDTSFTIDANNTDINSGNFSGSLVLNSNDFSWPNSNDISNLNLNANLSTKVSSGTTDPTMKKVFVSADLELATDTLKLINTVTTEYLECELIENAATEGEISSNSYCTFIMSLQTATSLEDIGTAIQTYTQTIEANGSAAGAIESALANLNISIMPNEVVITTQATVDLFGNDINIDQVELRITEQSVKLNLSGNTDLSEEELDSYIVLLKDTLHPIQEQEGEVYELVSGFLFLGMGLIEDLVTLKAD